ncbi:MAG: hypothetical protein JWP38_1250 [Herbaspirillum sp.]|jgi:hypothetical protein|nr:hypothetical protein [Herbaspirillum sp.]
MHLTATPSALSTPSRAVRRRLLSFVLALTAGAYAGNAAFAQDRAATQYAINPPPSADLHYTIDAQQSGLQLKGNGLVQWKADPQQYSVHNETSAQLFGKILDTRSDGKIDHYGLSPAQFVEKRLRKDASTTTFNAGSKTISFSQSQQTYPIVGGEQDRSSVVWQLLSIARAAPKKFVPGSEWKFFVAGERDADAWIFKVVNREKITTPKGEFNAIHVIRAAPPDSKDQKLDIWLAPTLEWYPVKLRFTDADGQYIEQTLESVSKAGA